MTVETEGTAESPMVQNDRFEPWPRLRATDSARWCAICEAWGGHHTDRHDQHVCSCGNSFDGDNLCMVSACQEET